MKYWNALGWILVIIGVVTLKPVLAQKGGLSTLNAQTTSPASLSIAGSKIDYYKNDHNAFTQIPASSFVNPENATGRVAAPTAQFIVTYTNFPTEARRAFQYAVDIWATLITSSVPIRIQANWVTQEPNILGSAGPTSYRYNFDGSQRATAFYPIALAEKVAHRQLNDPAEADIVADINRNNTWYYGTDGKTVKGQTDLVTAVLHELAHGLGFIGFFSAGVDGGGQGYGQYLSSIPSVYDCFIENKKRQHLANAQKEFPNKSVALHDQLTSDSLYLNGPLLLRSTGQKARLHANPFYVKGASIYHLDEDAYPPGNVNSLMTPRLNQAESIHTIGPLVQSFFSDLEWKTTSVLHTPVLNTEDTNDFVFSIRIISDTILATVPPRLVYRKTMPTATDTTATSVALARVGTTDTYQFTLPASQAQGEIWYYFQVRDVSGRTFTSPGKLAAGEQSWHHIRIGPDNVAPQILYSPAKNIILLTARADSLPIYTRIVDDRFGIGAAYIEYQINGVTQPNLPLRYQLYAIDNSTYGGIYTNRINFPANSVKAGDKITYRIVAQDSSRAKNQTVNPATGFYQLSVVNTLPPRDQYINSFTDANSVNDFAGYGFTITTETGFTNPAIHSEHPYVNGSDFRFQSNVDYVLLAPIRLKANPDSAVIRYDEVVLVEPADPGSKFGDVSFYDYVIVEGSKDNGQTWLPISDGYNAHDRNEWETAYKTNLIDGASGEKNSVTPGNLSMFRHRDLPILREGGAFQAGDQLLIRFRLFADQLSNGWGWAIDNLRIQAPPAPPVLANEPLSVGRLSIYPNPVSNGLVRLEADLVKPVSNVYLRVVSLTGQLLQQITLKTTGKKVTEQLNLSGLAAGVYYLHLAVQDAILTQKVIIAP